MRPIVCFCGWAVGPVRAQRIASASGSAIRRWCAKSSVFRTKPIRAFVGAHRDRGTSAHFKTILGTDAGLQDDGHREPLPPARDIRILWHRLPPPLDASAQSKRQLFRH